MKDNLADLAAVYAAVTHRRALPRRCLQSAIAMINLGVYGEVLRYETGEPNLGLIYNVASRLRDGELQDIRQPNR